MWGLSGDLKIMQNHVFYVLSGYIGRQEGIQNCSSCQQTFGGSPRAQNEAQNDPKMDPKLDPERRHKVRTNIQKEPSNPKVCRKLTPKFYRRKI